MKNIVLSALCVGHTFLLFGQQAVQLEVTRAPEGTVSIYIAGSFNNWNPADEQYRLKRDTNGFSIQLKLPPGQYEYKLTRGSWASVECNADGTPVQNRIMQVPLAGTVPVTVAGWQDLFKPVAKQSTAGPNVRIIDTAFYIPQLKRTRRVWVYLPESYKQQSAQRFPVLYMQDGQNLFDASTAYAGEWGIDEYLDSSRHTPCIVVGIDNGGGKRLNEYNPYDNKRFGKGEGSAYEAFLVYTLKPFIDRHFRTLPDKKHTAVAGSSMGGLISFYAALHYPKVFGTAGVFSPSFWINGNKAAEDVKQLAGRFAGNMYFYAGGQEGDTMAGDMQKIAAMLKQYPKTQVKTCTNPTAKHNEAAWKQEFPGFYEWMVKCMK